MRFKSWVLLIFAFFLTACGGGDAGTAPGAQSGGTGVEVTPVIPPPPVESSKSYRLVLAGTEGAAALKGVQLVLSLPPGAELRYDSSQAVLAESLSLSGLAPADAFLAAQKTVGGINVALFSGAGLGPGEFATLTCDLAPGATAPSAAGFAVRDLVAVGLDDNLLPGVSVTVQ